MAREALNWWVTWYGGHLTLALTSLITFFVFPQATPQ